MEPGMVGTKAEAGAWQSPKEVELDQQWTCLGHMLEISSQKPRFHMIPSDADSQGLEAG